MGRSSSSSRKFYYFVAVVGFLGLTMFGVQVLHENELRRRLPQGQTLMRSFASSSSSDASKGVSTSGGKNDGGKTPSASASPENQSQDKAAQTCPFSGRRRLPEGLTAVFARQASRSSSSNASKGENTSGSKNDGDKTQSASVSPRINLGTRLQKLVISSELPLFVLYTC